MADDEATPFTTSTTNYGFVKPDVGASDDVWGGLLNTDLDNIDSTIKIVSNVANAAYPASNPSGYQTAAQVTAVVPVASSTTPLVDGTAVVGIGTTWARADHVHPTDTSRYAATNPNGYQTAAQVTASLASYLPLAGGTLTGILNGTSATFSGTITTNGYTCRSGGGGTTRPNSFNIDWTGATGTHIWVDATDLGQVSFVCDYRIKENIAPLPSTWDRVKALNPISYTHKDYTPSVELERDPSAKPFLIGDDKERWGFVAHELQETLIEDAATGVKDQANCIQSPNVVTIIATLTKALQEAMARIEALEAAR